MNRQVILAALAAFALHGCVGLGETKTYTRLPMQTFKDTRDNWKIYDKPTEGKLLIEPSERWPLTLFPGSIRMSEYQRAAEGWLAASARVCIVAGGDMLVGAAWEFEYRCN